MTKVRYAIWLALVAGMCALTCVAEETKRGVQAHATYAGISIGQGGINNTIVDRKGFANWGQTGYAVDYDDDALVGGFFVGKEILACGSNFRFEFDTTFSNLSASSNQLDPQGLDETVISEIKWLSSLKVGVVQYFGANAISAAIGIAAGSVENSVTDIDFGPGVPDRVDPDDSFDDKSILGGTLASFAIERCLSEEWSVRMEAMFVDLGRSRFYVNRMGDARCGPGQARQPCPYSVDNLIKFFRLSIMRKFGQ